MSRGTQKYRSTICIVDLSHARIVVWLQFVVWRQWFVVTKFQLQCKMREAQKFFLRLARECNLYSLLEFDQMWMGGFWTDLCKKWSHREMRSYQTKIGVVKPEGEIKISQMHSFDINYHEDDVGLTTISHEMSSDDWSIEYWVSRYHDFRHAAAQNVTEDCTFVPDLLRHR